jgi:hypothetical protein
MSEMIINYECHPTGENHTVPGLDVQVMKIGDGGFVIACDCSEESLDDVDEEPHPTTDHFVNVYATDPSPNGWLVLEDAADGWYNTTRWHSPDDFDGTHGQRRAEFRDKIEEIADDNDENQRGGADEIDEAVRAVACPECDAGVGQKCKRPSGHRVRKSHARRKETAREQGILEDDEEDDLAQSSLDAYAGGEPAR